MSAAPATGPADTALRARAQKVIPNGMYGHQSVGMLPAAAPQFFAEAKGAYLWDVDGKRYVDFMCGYGPNLLGYRHEEIDAAYIDQLRKIDAATGPSACMVELAEAFCGQVGHADWALFCKNGTDATTMALMTARAHRGKRKVLMAQGAYHGASTWCTPAPAGTTPEDRAHFIHYTYNDVASLEAAAAEAGDNLAGIFASPFKHDVFVDQELPDPAYAEAARRICDTKDALLIVDDIRAGFRMARDCSWQAIGLAPDLSSWGKAIANGHPLSCLLGSDRARAAAEQLYVTGSFWFAAAAMAASLKTLEIIRTSDYLETTIALGDALSLEDDPLRRRQPDPGHVAGLALGLAAPPGARLHLVHRLFLHHPRGRLVVAQSLEDTMADMALAGELGEIDLRHQRGVQVMRAATYVGRHGFERAVLARQGCEALREIVEGLAVEAGAHAAAIDELSSLMHADEDGREWAAGLVRGGIAADDEFLPAAAFRFQPRFGPASGIRRVGALRDDTLQALAAQFGEYIRPMAQDMRAVVKGRSVRARHQGFQSGLALCQRLAGQVLSILLEKVETEARQRPAIGQRFLQGREVRSSRAIESNDLPVDKEAFRRQRLDMS